MPGSRAVPNVDRLFPNTRENTYPPQAREPTQLRSGYAPLGLGKITTGLKGAEASAAATAAGDLGKVKITSPPFGGPTRITYRDTFFETNPTLIKSDFVVHHAVEKQVLNLYPGLFTQEEINLLFNLRGVPKTINGDLHLKALRVEWNKFYKLNPNASRQQIIDYKMTLDQKYGHLFNPEVK